MGGGLRGAVRRGGGYRRVGWLGGGGPGQRFGGGGTCPQGQALVNHRLPLPPLDLPLTIPSL